MPRYTVHVLLQGVARDNPIQLDVPSDELASSTVDRMARQLSGADPKMRYFIRVESDVGEVIAQVEATPPSG